MASNEKKERVAGVERQEKEEKKTDSAAPRPSPKPLPNYLKPTISSVHQSTCRYTKNQHDSPPSRRPPPKASLRKSSSPRESEKPSKTPPPTTGRPAAAPSLRKARSLPRAREQGDHAKPPSPAPPKSKMVRSKLADNIAQGDSNKPRTRARSLSLTAIEASAAGPRKANPALKRSALTKKSATKKEGKDNAKEQQPQPAPAPAAHDGEATAAVGTEEAARRNNVKSLLAGAFETVISLHESETQEPGQHHDEAAPAEKVVGEGQPGQHFQGEESNEIPPVEVIKEAAAEDEEEEAGDVAEAGKLEGPHKDGLTESNRSTGEEEEEVLNN